MNNFLIISHRGMGPTSTLATEDFTAEQFPENSIAAFKCSFAFNVDGLEFDVHRTFDNQVAVIHDDDLNKKVAHKGRIGQDLGRVSNHSMDELKKYDIGHGHSIPSLKEVLEAITEENKKRKENGKPNLVIDIELKGENTVDVTYNQILEYIETGKLDVEDFVFNSFYWDRLKEIKALDTRFKVVPATRTMDLFGAENVQMPGFNVDPDMKYQQTGLNAMQEFHQEVGCYAFDCIVFDLRPEMIDFCANNGVGLLTSTSKDAIKADKMKKQLALMLEASAVLPVVCFRADHAEQTNDILKEIIFDKALEAKLNL